MSTIFVIVRNGEVDFKFHFPKNILLNAMYQHSDVKSLNTVAACRDTLYTSYTLFPDDRSIQDSKSTCADSSTNVTPIGYISAFFFAIILDIAANKLYNNLS